MRRTRSAHSITIAGQTCVRVIVSMLLTQHMKPPNSIMKPSKMMGSINLHHSESQDSEKAQISDPQIHRQKRFPRRISRVTVCDHSQEAARLVQAGLEPPGWSRQGWSRRACPGKAGAAGLGSCLGCWGLGGCEVVVSRNHSMPRPVPPPPHAAPDGPAPRVPPPHRDCWWLGPAKSH